MSTQKIKGQEPTDSSSTSRLNVNLPSTAYSDLKRLADESGTTMTEIVRTALGLAKVAYDEQKANHRIMVTDEDGEVIKEIVVPR